MESSFRATIEEKKEGKEYCEGGEEGKSPHISYTYPRLVKEKESTLYFNPPLPPRGEIRNGNLPSLFPRRVTGKETLYQLPLGIERGGPGG